MGFLEDMLILLIYSSSTKNDFLKNCFLNVLIFNNKWIIVQLALNVLILILKVNESIF